jgi:hypothetical protein
VEHKILVKNPDVDILAQIKTLFCTVFLSLTNTVPHTKTDSSHSTISSDL